MKLYKEFLQLESDFVPVFSASSDRTIPNKWKSFYPHESFKKVLTSAIETLEKSSNMKNRPIWMYGSYGTGKTFASFVIKHIFEDDLSNVEKYFQHNEQLNSLWARLVGVRSKGDILVVHQSSSAGITSQNKLFNVIVESVKRSLREKGYKYMGSASIMDKVFDTLTDDEATFNFRSAFKKHRGNFSEYTSPEEVIYDLKTLDDEEKINLLEQITAVAEKESYNWAMTINDVIDWLKDVREKNKLYAIFFIWDEFTEYFKNNLNNITGLQEIAQASAELSFYFFLITHSDANQLITDSVQRKIIEARFKLCTITLAESTAFQLMAQAVGVEPDMKNDWEHFSRELWEIVKREAADFIMKRDTTIQPADMKKLLPIHPYAAYLLKFISQQISSNQRTMFQFLCANYSEDDEEHRNFKWFINNYGVEGWRGDYLTVNFLWDYFFHLDNPDLDKTFQEAIAYYNNFAEICENENQRSVLKATLTLFALQSTVYSRSGGATSLLRASLKNICACFVGTSFENDVRQILNIFASKGIVTAIQQSDDIYYVMATAQVDNERMEKLLEKVKHERTFDTIITDENLKVAKSFYPSNFLKYRYKIKFISPKKYLSASHEDLSLADNQILAFYLFAADEEEQGKINQTIAKIYEKFPSRCVVVDFSGTPFTKQRYEKFVQNKAKELYFREIPNQREQMTLAGKTANDLVEEWNRQLDITTYRVYSSATESNVFSGAINLVRQLEELNRKFYGCGLEEISMNDKLFSPQGFQDKVAKYALGTEKIPGSYNYLIGIENAFKEIDGRNDKNYWLNNPSSTISKMKKIVEEIIGYGFEKNNSVRFAEIWQTLKKPPVGLIRSIGAAYLLAILLKEYVDSNFYIRDVNNNTYSLTADKISNLIVSAIKETLQTDQFIVKQTPEHILFCKVTGEIFNIPESNRSSIDDIAKSVNLRLTQNYYPVWSLKYYAEEKYSVSDYKEEILHFIDLMEEFINPRTVTAREKTKIAEDIYLIYKKNLAVVSELKNLVQSNNFKSGMNYYIAEYKPELIQIFGRLKLTEPEYLSRLNEKLSADSAYLWKVDDLNKQIDRLYEELLLIEAINSILATPQKKIFDARESLRDKLNRIKIPRAIVEEFQSDLKNFFQVFQALQSSSLKNPEQMAIQIKISADTFKDFFEKQSATFAAAIRKYVDSSLDDKTVSNLFLNAPAGNFFKTKDDFILQVKQFLQNIRRNEKIQKIFLMWQEVTGTKSPADWSNQNKIPILCMFQDCLREAQNIFSALNRNSQNLSENEIETALNFIQSDKLKCLQDKNSCEKAFVNFFGGEYSPVLQANDLRKILQEKSGDNVYNWYDEKYNCKNKIEAYAQNNYHKYFITQVQKKIHELSAEQAQKYLEELIKKDVLLGIRVLKNS
ncbi:MAG: hypothetical protein IJT73_11225 [Selenomonadaceae bacterium]|nr:hypothetical protein [Selenomonadaceae bacterium]